MWGSADHVDQRSDAVNRDTDFVAVLESDFQLHRLEVRRLLTTAFVDASNILQIGGTVNAFLSYNNLIGDGSGGLINGANGNIVGNAAQPIRNERQSKVYAHDVPLSPGRGQSAPKS